MATQTQVKEFIEKIAPIIQKYAKKNGYKICSTVIAQACCESAYGTSSLGYKYHNYFGMKCGGSWKGKSVNMTTKEEYTVGTLTTIKDNFRAYDSIDEGVQGYYAFISAKRYANLKDATSYRQYAEMLKSDGYATSSTYVNTLCTIVEKYDLAKYDNFNGVNIPVTPSPTTTSLPKFVVGRNYTLQYNMFVRDAAAGNKKPWSKLTVSGKSHSIRQSDGSAVMKKGTVVTCQDTKTVDGSVWIKIPSGWVCGYGKEGTKYVI